MDCSCMIDHQGDTTGEDFFPPKIVTSRKITKCVECCQEIPAGERHLLEAVKWNEEEGISVYRTCIGCKSLRDVLCCSWMYGMVLDDIRDALYDIPDDGIPWAAFSKLTPGARQYVLSIVEEMWFEREKDGEYDE